MGSPLRFPHLIALLLIAGLPLLGCLGRVDRGSSGGPGGSSGGISSSSGGSRSGIPSSSSSGSTGSSSGISSSSSSGGVGDPDCSLLGVPDLARVCPDGTSVGGHYVLSNHQCVLEFTCPPPSPPPPSSCAQGAVCNPSTGCRTIATNPGTCTSTCNCDNTGHYQCAVLCGPPPQPPGSCTQGAACTPGEGCGGGSSGGPGDAGCDTSCTCNAMGFFDCTTDCPDAGPPPMEAAACAVVPLAAPADAAIASCFTCVATMCMADLATCSTDCMCSSAYQCLEQNSTQGSLNTGYSLCQSAVSALADGNAALMTLQSCATEMCNSQCFGGGGSTSGD